MTVVIWCGDADYGSGVNISSKVYNLLVPILSIREKRERERGTRSSYFELSKTVSR